MTVASVNNGNRVAVMLSDFEGEAGMVTRTGQTYLSYIPDGSGRGLPVVAGGVIDVEGQSWAVIKAGRSTFIPTMVVLVIKEVAHAA